MASSVLRSLSWKLTPVEPATYQRSSKSWAETACATLRPPSSATQRSFLFMFSSLIRVKKLDAFSFRSDGRMSARLRFCLTYPTYDGPHEGLVNATITV